MDPSLAVELLREYPQLVAVVAIVARVARAWQASLTWPEYVVVHRFKRGVFPVVDRVAGGAILWVSEKGGRDDAEFLTTIDAPYRDVVATLRAGGGSLHLLNSLKRRPDAHGDPLSIAHLVWTHDDGTQSEAYLFANADGSTDVYVHHEPSTDHPLRHLTGSQSNGDVRGVVAAALEKESATKSRAESDAHPAASRRRRRSHAPLTL